MNIDQAIEQIGAATVLEILNSGHAQDAGHPDSFRGRAARAHIKGSLMREVAYGSLASARECEVRQATKSPERLEREFLEDGSGRAYAEMIRRGIPLPQAYDLLPARL